MGRLDSAGLVWLIPWLPLAGAAFHAAFGGRIIQRLGDRTGRRLVGGVGVGVVLAAFVVSVVVLSSLMTLGPEERRATAGLGPGGMRLAWLDIGSLRVPFEALVDPLSLLMCLIVTGVGGLIHLYATGYMSHDRDYARFFTYFNLFIFMMLVLVLGGNLLLMFVGWEGVGLCSYLLISFWYEDAANAKAGNKAFIVNRVGDVGFALGIMAVFTAFGTLTFRSPAGTGVLDLACRQETALGPLLPSTATVIALLLFVGACGKSAQFPLHIWLPDAMAGPTPVSALIHAATMVTAGVVMVTRMSPIFVQSPTAMTVVVVIGIFTALFAATIALTQNDIKKVLAYSTVSQLGFMFLGCGAGAFAAGMFHVTTHAFFKALLFLGAGSVIHALSGEQDMRRMGGLGRLIPWTYWTMFVGWAAISGFPGLAGFWSKDEILGYAAGVPSIGAAVYAVGLFTATLTGFYMTRLMAKTFWTSARFDGRHDDTAAHGASAHVHESPPSMLVPLAVLAVLAAVGGLLGLPWANVFERFLEPSLPPHELVRAHHGISVVQGLEIGAAVALAAMLSGWWLYRTRGAAGELASEAAKAKMPAYVAASRLWFVDAAATGVFVTAGGRAATLVWKVVDRALLDGAVNAVAVLVGLGAEVLRGTQTGYLRGYAMAMLTGAVVVLIIALGAVR